MTTENLSVSALEAMLAEARAKAAKEEQAAAEAAKEAAKARKDVLIAERAAYLAAVSEEIAGLNKIMGIGPGRPRKARTEAPAEADPVTQEQPESVES